MKHVKNSQINFDDYIKYLEYIKILNQEKINEIIK
jgi:hypothetical protein